MEPGSEKRWYGIYDDTHWILNTNSGENASEHDISGNPIFRCTRALERGQFRSKEEVKEKHFTACEENVQLLLKMVMSVNQLSFYGAIADMIQGLLEDQVAPGRPVASDQKEQKILIQLPIAEVPSNEERQGNLLQDYEQRFERLLEDQKLSELGSEAGLILAEVGKFFHALPSPKEPKIRSLCREYALLREDEEEHVQKGGSEATNDSALSWR